jgi:hypothetical protein
MPTEYTLVPYPLVAVSVYIVVVVGDTTILPLAGTGPIAGEMNTCVAFITVHWRVAVPPTWMVPGLILNSSSRGKSAIGGTWFTVMVTDRDTLQHELLAVIV